MHFAAPIAGCVHGKSKLEIPRGLTLTSLRQATELHTENANQSLSKNT